MNCLINDIKNLRKIKSINDIDESVDKTQFLILNLQELQTVINKTLAKQTYSSSVCILLNDMNDAINIFIDKITSSNDIYDKIRVYNTCLTCIKHIGYRL